MTRAGKMLACSLAAFPLPRSRLLVCFCRSPLATASALQVHISLDGFCFVQPSTSSHRGSVVSALPRCFVFDRSGSQSSTNRLLLIVYSQVYIVLVSSSSLRFSSHRTWSHRLIVQVRSRLTRLTSPQSSSMYTTILFVAYREPRVESSSTCRRR